jgi:hypothetical protein
VAGARNFNENQGQQKTDEQEAVFSLLLGIDTAYTVLRKFYE